MKKNKENNTLPTDMLLLLEFSSASLSKKIQKLLFLNKSAWSS